MPAEPIRVSVVVPTYRRPDLMANCVAGLRRQTRPPEEIVVVHRSDDDETVARLANEAGVTTVAVSEPGVLAAMNAGVAASTGTVVAFIDDDAVAHSDWLHRLVDHLADPAVGGVGGRDMVQTLADPTAVTDADIGLITRWGKLVGNHHLGQGPARDVTVLKAVNMAFRREALALPRTLRGTGAQVHFEVAVGLWARQRGWRLVYDPAVLVDHYPGPRFDADRRERPDPVATRDAAYNLVTALVGLDETLGLRRAAFGLFVGDAMTPGVLRATIAAVRREWPVCHRLLPSLRGQLAAFRDHWLGGRLEMVPAPMVKTSHLAPESNDPPVTPFG